MEFVVRGKVRAGGLVLADPLTMPEGTEVVVHISEARKTGRRPQARSLPGKTWHRCHFAGCGVTARI